MTYRLASTLLGAALLVAACAPAEEDSGASDASATSGDRDDEGGSNEVFLGTGGVPAGDGDLSPAEGGATTGDGDGVGDGDFTGDGDGERPAGAGGASAASGGSGTGAGTGAGGSASVGECSPDPDGEFVVEGETVFDGRTCLTWMRDNTTGDPYSEAAAYCDDLILGGYEDWRIPTAGEAATIFKCDGMWPPIDDTVFNVMGDGIWTSTETGTIAGDLPKVCGAGQSSGSYYDFGQVGGQNTRCVRGKGNVPDRPNCMTDLAICQ